MSSKKLNCQTCSNQVNGDYCTMHLDMHWKSMVYKKCQGYQEYVAPIKKEIIIEKKEKIEDYDELGKFGKFLKKGGHYSFRTKEFIGVND